MANPTLRAASGFAAISVLLSACEISGPGKPSAVGSWHATTWVTAERDEINAGSTITLVLTADGRTSGHLHIAASAASPAVDEDLTGTWQSLLGDRISLSHPAETFLKHVELFVEKHILWTNSLIGNTGVHLEFNRT